MSDRTPSEKVDVEEDNLYEAWCVTPTESCTFVALAVFVEKKDAEAFVTILRKRRKASNTHDDLAVLPARALVLVANSYDVKAGRAALAKAQP